MFMSHMPIQAAKLKGFHKNTKMILFLYEDNTLL